MGALGEAAAALAGAGFSVLPLQRAGKAPAIKGGCRAASSDPAQVDAWWAASPWSNVGVACGAASGGLVVIDVDVDGETGEDGMATLAAWEGEHGALPETVTVVTGRGGRHLWYRSAVPVRNSANKGLGIDVRGEGGFVVAPPSVHPNGGAYEWGVSPEDMEPAEADANVLALIAHVQRRPQAAQGGGGRFELPDEVEAGGRNDTLFRYASSLQAKGKDDGFILDAVRAANRERCVPPLPASDVERLVASALSYEKGAGAGRRAFRKLDRHGNPTGPVLHDAVAAELIQARSACLVDGAPAIWDGRRYAVGWFEVERAIIELVPDSRIADRREVRTLLLHTAPRVEPSPPSLIQFENGVLDLDGTDQVREPSPDDVITNIIPHAYRAGAYDAAADAFLERVSCGVPEVRANLEEVIGMCMYRRNAFGKCPVLVGAGSNGKSTYILAVRSVLGNDNVSALDLGYMGRQFQAVQLMGKLANLGDDISNERLSGDVLAVFKKVVTGDWVYTDVKNGEGVTFRPFATPVFSCNEFPSLGDSSDGVMRRLFPIPFDARFSRGDPGFDPWISDRLSTEPAAEYLARVGVEGLRRVLAQRGLTPNARSAEMVREVRSDNDTVLQWAEDEGEGAGRLEGRVIAECYEGYVAWCRGANLRPYGRSRFTRRVNAEFGLRSAVERRRYADGPRSVRVFRAAGGPEEGAP